MDTRLDSLKAIFREKKNPAALLFLLSFLLLVLTQGHYGLAWDEPYNFTPMLWALNWIKLLFTHPSMALTPDSINMYWSSISEHPSFSKVLAAVSYGIFQPKLGEELAFRLGSITFFSVFIGFLYGAMVNWFKPRVALFSALALLGMPRLFAQAHFATTDIPMMVMAFFTVYCFYKGLFDWKWSVGLGVVWGLALATKINALFLPIPLIFWAHYYHREKWSRNIVCLIFISPVIFLLSWPWLWNKTLARFFEYLQFYTGHKFTTVFYLGKQYTLIPSPWHYPWVYVLGTIPLAILILIFLGGGDSLGRLIFKRDKSEEAARKSLVLLMALFPIVFQSMPGTPRYDGIRLFLSAFPFLAILAGLGFEKILLWLREYPWTQKIPALEAVLMVILLLPSGVGILHCHPYELSYYNSLMGGVSGAYQKGMETTYWCDAINPQFLDKLNQKLPPDSTIQFLSFSDEVLRWYQDHGRLREDINLQPSPENPPDFYILQCRQGFFGRNEWYIYRNFYPIDSVKIEGVPFVNIYKVR